MKVQTDKHGIENTLDWQYESSIDAESSDFTGNEGASSLITLEPALFPNTPYAHYFQNDSEDLVVIEDGSELNNELDFTPKEAVFVSNLLAGKQIKESAKLAGMSERSAHRILKEDRVQRYLRDASNRILAESERRLLIGSSRAIDTLLELINDPDASASVRLKASVSVLDFSMKQNEQGILAQATYWMDRISNDEELNGFGMIRSNGSGDY